MPTPRTPREVIEKTVSAYEDAKRRGYRDKGIPSAISEAGIQLGIERRTIQHHLKLARDFYGIGGKSEGVSLNAKLAIQKETREALAPTLPDFPDDDIPDDRIIDLMCERFTKRAAHKASKKWFRIQMPDDRPFAIMWWGDPHLDSNGCNWPLLKTHAELAQADGVYSVNIGDTLDNWPNGSRLVALYAHSDTSVETARKLARWFLKKAGIRWLVWLMGNHDTWPGHTSTDWLREVGGKGVAFEDWGAQFVLSCPGGQEFKIWAAHDFPGHSMWNPLHGPKKAASMKEEADVYVCGHRHNWALYREESAERGFSYSLIRTRGYKYIDEHADKLGHFPQQYGASVLTVFDPASGRHYDFEHPEDGVKFLRAIR